MAKKEQTEVEKYRFKTGSDLLDIVVGGGMGLGYPAGRIINLVGDKSAGKTFQACELVAAAVHAYGKKVKWVYDDAESGFSFDTKSLYGIEIMPQNDADRVKSPTVEAWSCNVRKFISDLKSDELGIYILDSLDGLSSEETDGRVKDRQTAFEAGKKFDKGSYQMGAAKFLSQEFFKTLSDEIERSNCLLVIVSQVRENVDPMSFEKYSRSGGKALDFYAHTVVWLATRQKLKRKDRVVGVLGRAKTTKSKTPRPFRECDFILYFDYGFDNIGANLDYLFDLRTPTGELKKDAKVQWEGKEVTVSGLTEFVKTHGDWSALCKKYSYQPKKSEILEWIENTSDLKKLYDTEYGTTMTRDEAIEWIEKNNKEEELRKKVEDKWEAFEAEIKTVRKPRYV